MPCLIERWCTSTGAAPFLNSCCVSGPRRFRTGSERDARSLSDASFGGRLCAIVGDGELHATSTAMPVAIIITAVRAFLEMRRVRIFMVCLGLFEATLPDL